MTAYLHSLILSLALMGGFSVCAIFARRKLRRGEIITFTPLQYLVVGCFAAAAALLVPVYLFADGARSLGFFAWIRATYASVYDGIRLFIIEGSYQTIGEIVNAGEELPVWFAVVYNLYSGFLYLLAPIFTAGFVLSLFKNVFAKFRYSFRLLRRDVYIMSCVNERSVTLAEDIVKQYRGGAESDVKRMKRHPLIVFTDVYENEDEESSELYDRAKELSAIRFQNDITKIKLKKPWSCSRRERRVETRFNQLNDALKNHVKDLLLTEANQLADILDGIEKDIKYHADLVFDRTDKRNAEKVYAIDHMADIFDQYFELLFGNLEAECLHCVPDDQTRTWLLNRVDHAPYHAETAEALAQLRDALMRGEDITSHMTGLSKQLGADFNRVFRENRDRAVGILARMYAGTAHMPDEASAELLLRWLGTFATYIALVKQQRLDIINRLEKPDARAREAAHAFFTALENTGSDYEIETVRALLAGKTQGIPAIKNADHIARLGEAVGASRTMLDGILLDIDAVAPAVAGRAALLTRVIIEKLEILDCYPRYHALQEKRDMKHHTKLYFIGIDEDENLEQALTIIDHCSGKRGYDTPNMEMYVFARTVESTVLLSAADKGEMKVRRVQEDENLAWQILDEHSIFEDALRRDAVLSMAEKTGEGSFRRYLEKCAHVYAGQFAATPVAEPGIALPALHDSAAGTAPSVCTLKEIIEYNLLKRYQLSVQNPSKMNIVIVGLGDHGTEIMKVISWAGQMVGFEINIHVFDMQPDMQETVRSFAPGLFAEIERDGKLASQAEMSGGDICSVILNADNSKKGCPRLSMKFYNNTDVDTYAFQKQIAEINRETPISSVFVTLGNDELNIKTAFLIRRILCQEKGSLLGYYATSVYAIVYSPAKNQLVKNRGVLKTAGVGGVLFKHTIKDDSAIPENRRTVVLDEEYGITFIGGMRERFSLRVLEAKRLEDAAAVCHAKWTENAVSEDMKRAVAESYLNKYEYHRRSSIASALHKEFIGKLNYSQHLDCEGIINLGDTKDSAISALLHEYEHRRWCVYLYMDGYVYSQNGKSELAKTHNLLISYFGLDKQSRQKNNN